AQPQLPRFYRSSPLPPSSYVNPLHVSREKCARVISLCLAADQAKCQHSLLGQCAAHTALSELFLSEAENRKMVKKNPLVCTHPSPSVPPGIANACRCNDFFMGSSVLPSERETHAPVRNIHLPLAVHYALLAQGESATLLRRVLARDEAEAAASIAGEREGSERESEVVPLDEGDDEGADRGEQELATCTAMACRHLHAMCLMRLGWALRTHSIPQASFLYFDRFNREIRPILAAMPHTPLSGGRGTLSLSEVLLGQDPDSLLQLSGRGVPKLILDPDHVFDHCEALHELTETARQFRFSPATIRIGLEAAMQSQEILAFGLLDNETVMTPELQDRLMEMQAAEKQTPTATAPTDQGFASPSVPAYADPDREVVGELSLDELGGRPSFQYSTDGSVDIALLLLIDCCNQCDTLGFLPLYLVALHRLTYLCTNVLENSDPVQASLDSLKAFAKSCSEYQGGDVYVQVILSIIHKLLADLSQGNKKRDHLQHRYEFVKNNEENVSKREVAIAAADLGASRARLGDTSGGLDKLKEAWRFLGGTEDGASYVETARFRLGLAQGDMAARELLEGVEGGELEDCEDGDLDALLGSLK
ncbi:hypothetical protein KIPB_004721, partial [Kipferlia bialata]